MRIRLFSLILILLLVMIGCTNSPAQKPQSQDQDTKQEEKQVAVDPELADQVKQSAKSVGGVEDATSVVVDKKYPQPLK
ncbi:hypothetical protein N752_10965 [Desulforamulus aquiferis]|nr:hypothetical protein [Desulforamulus aquiferis]RYD05085.1 hypothetical protein N752_10965 [Desulforamulus aquiferis]